MSRTRLDTMNCGIAQALEVLGDWWTLLIVRDAFFGVRRFKDFQADLGIASNVLADRLAHLVAHEILEKLPVGDSQTRFEYRLTDAGEALLPVLTALREWSDEWIYGPGAEPVRMQDRRGRPIPRLRVQDADGQPLARRDIVTVPGPGATPRTRAQLARSPVRPDSPRE